MLKSCNYHFPTVGVPDTPVIRLENESIIVWTPLTNNGRNITRYIVTVDSAEYVANVVQLPTVYCNIIVCTLYYVHVVYMLCTCYMLLYKCCVQ